MQSLARLQIEGPSMQRTNDPPILYDSLPQRPLLMRADSVEYRDFSANPSHAEVPSCSHNLASFALGRQFFFRADFEQARHGKPFMPMNSNLMLAGRAKGRLAIPGV
jgi:hypothetical protein